MIHCMIDIETWGLAPGYAIRSIGAVTFDPEGNDVEDTFYANISTQSCVDVALKLDRGTAAWWEEQSAAARAKLETKQRPLAVVGYDFREWYLGEKAEAVWSHGLAFDVPMWEFAMVAIKPAIGVPWGYRDGRDTRTLFSLVPDFRHDSIPFEGEPHDALADAIHQAKLVQHAYRMLHARK